VDAAMLLRGIRIPPSRLLSLRVDSRRVALLVTTVVGVEPAPEASDLALPPLLDPELASVQLLTQRDLRLFVVLSAARIVDSLYEGGTSGEFAHP
jgi:hypothetical protein